MAKESGYNDRASGTANENALPKPQIEIIVDGQSFFKPGMRTYFVDSASNGSGGEQWNTQVMGEFCVCDTVQSTKGSCGCDSYCTCDSYKPCTADCSCVGYSSSGSIGGGRICTCQSVSCGSPCACVPVS